MVGATLSLLCAQTIDSNNSCQYPLPLKRILFSGRGYWQELFESIVWAHNKLKVAPTIQPRALSITQGRAVGVTHFLVGGIATTWAFFHARLFGLG